MARRRRKRFAAKSGVQTHARRTPIARGSVPDVDPVGPPSSPTKQQKRPMSDHHTGDGKRRRVEDAQEGVSSPENPDQSVPLQGESTRPGPAVSHDDPVPGNLSGETGDDRAGQGSHRDGSNEFPILVTCGRNDGHLYLSKLRVVVNERCRTKCIRTGNTWWTPNEFQSVSGRGAAKDWKRTVKHSGQCLKVLMTKGMLCLTSIPPRCFCKPCGQMEPGRTFVSSGKQKEQEKEHNDDVREDSETQDVSVMARSKGHEVKRSGFRLIKTQRRGKRHIKDVVDRKQTSSSLPVKKKSRKPEPREPDPNVDENRLDLRGPRGRGRPRKGLDLRLSSASPESVACQPEGALEGCCNDQGATGFAPSEVRDTAKLSDAIPDKYSTGRKPSDDVIVADVTDSFSMESSKVSSHPVAKPEMECIDWTSADAQVTAACDLGAAKNPSGNDVTDRENDVTDPIVSPTSSSTASATTAPRKTASLDAIIEELKRKKKSRELGVVAPIASISVGAMDEEGQKKVVSAAATPSTIKLPPTADSIKSEINLDDEVRDGHHPAETFIILTDTKPTSLKPTLTRDLVQDSRASGPGALRKRPPDPSERRRKVTAPTFHPGDQAPRRPGPPSKIADDEKDAGVGSYSEGHFGVPGWKFDPKGTAMGPANSALDISQLARMYGLNASSPLTSLPLQQSQFPFFPPYLFMGFPLQPLLPPPPPPQFPSGVPPSKTQHWNKNQMTSSSSKDSKLQRERSSSSSSSSSSMADHFAALRKAVPTSNYTPSDIHLWRRLATDFSTQSWATGNANSTGNGRSHSGSARHPIWRPDLEATVPRRPFAHAQKQPEMTAAKNRYYKSEFSVPVEKVKQSDGFAGKGGSSGDGSHPCDDQGALDLSRK